MRFLGGRRDSKEFLVVDEDCGIPTSVVDSYRACSDPGPTAQADPRSYLLSMSEYDKSQNYEVYDYQTAATRPEPEHEHHPYAEFAAHPDYTDDYVTPQADVPSGLAQSSATLALLPAAQPFDTHDPTYFGQQVSHYPAYLDSTPRASPEIISYSPNHGRHGTKVTVYLQSVYDFDALQVTAIIMFGHKRCDSVLMKTAHQDHAYHYALSADAPLLASTSCASPQVPVQLLLDDGSASWESPAIEFGQFTYLDQPAYFQLDSPQLPTSTVVPSVRKRKLSPQASPRHSPQKRASAQPLPDPSTSQVSAATIASFRRPSVPEAYLQARRMTTALDYQPMYGHNGSRVPSQSACYGRDAGATTPSLPSSRSPSWTYPTGMPSTTRSASVATMGRSTQLLPSPAVVNNPTLIRTSTLQPSPPLTGASVPTATPFNPYAMYTSNAKAVLKIDGDLNAMADKWTSEEWDAKRRLVQFRRSQTGSVITTTFEAVTLEDRIPNSICVSCIWWEEKQECYVTSVDTISLLESLVAVRFTVEEKNRIRRNLEGFRPATVSKTKVDSEEFFKLIMGFPNPKPRNIEKDVKVFPWRILTTALKKIIGKYASHPSWSADPSPANSRLQSASYSSTAGALHPSMGGSSYLHGRLSDAGMDPRAMPSPRSSTSSVSLPGAGYGAVLATGHSAYSTHASGGSGGIGLGPPAAVPADLRLTVPTSTAALPTTSWHASASSYAPEADVSARAWDLNTYFTPSPMAGLPASIPSYHFQQRIPALTAPVSMAPESKFVPLHEYEAASQPTSTA